MWKFWKRTPRSVTVANNSRELAATSYAHQEATGAQDPKLAIYHKLSAAQADNAPIAAEDLVALLYAYYNVKLHLGFYRLRESETSPVHFTLKHCQLLESKKCGSLLEVMLVFEDDSMGTRSRLLVCASELYQILEPVTINLKQLRASRLNKP